MALYWQAHNTKLETQKKYETLRAALSMRQHVGEMICRGGCQSNNHIRINGVGFLFCQRPTKDDANSVMTASPVTRARTFQVASCLHHRSHTSSVTVLQKSAIFPLDLPDF
jgi:hypothetical protein